MTTAAVPLITEPQPCPTALSPEQLAHFREYGFLAVRDLLSPDEVTTAREHISALVQGMLAKADKAPENGHMQDPETTLQVQLEPKATIADIHDPANELLVRKLMRYTHADAFFHHLAHAHARLHGVVTSILGVDPILFQDMALIKPPRIGSEKPWHQDNAYFAVTPLDAVLGVWIALDDATVENGCMHVQPAGQQRGPLRHYHHRDCEIVPERMGDYAGQPVPVPAGGALFFLGMLPHRTPQNHSDQRRRALQLHYRSADSIQNQTADYDRIFAETDGSPASCGASQRRAKGELPA